MAWILEMQRAKPLSSLFPPGPDPPHAAIISSEPYHIADIASPDAGKHHSWATVVASATAVRVVRLAMAMDMRVATTAQASPTSNVLKDLHLQTQANKPQGIHMPAGQSSQSGERLSGTPVYR